MCVFACECVKQREQEREQARQSVGVCRCGCKCVVGASGGKVKRVVHTDSRVIHTRITHECPLTPPLPSYTCVCGRETIWNRNSELLSATQCLPLSVYHSVCDTQSEHLCVCLPVCILKWKVVCATWEGGNARNEAPTY